MRLPSGLVFAPVIAGCSFLYNPNNLPSANGSVDIDGVPDAAPVLDSNPSQLELIDIQPAVIDEGQGDGGSTPALLVIRGHQMSNDSLKVTLNPVGGATVKLDPISDAKASHDGDYIAFTVKAHVDRALASDVALDVVVSQAVPAQYGGGTAIKSLTGRLTLRGLPELLASSAGVDVGKKQLTVPVAAKYSQVDLHDVSPLAIVGGTRAEITAVANMVFGDVHADATNATTAGPGGFPGGSTAGQGPGGGGHGGDATISGILAVGGGGGGGGAANPGGVGATGASTLGAGGAGGTAGGRVGDDLILSFDDNAASAGGAGGMGGTLILTQAGGAGGAGGGTLALTAGGNIMAGAISANGASGVPGGGSGGAGGGGGAGGVVMVRSHAGALAITTINVKGGPGAGPGGGTGSVGRVRWDAATGGAPSSPDRAAHRGPAFTTTTRVFTRQIAELTLAGAANDGFAIRVIDRANMVHDGGHASFNSQGVATIHPVLEAGHDQVCITLDGGMQGRSEADKCLDVAFLP